MLGGRWGNGVLVTRDSRVRFSNPVFITLAGGSVGLADRRAVPPTSCWCSRTSAASRASRTASSRWARALPWPRVLGSRRRGRRGRQCRGLFVFAQSRPSRRPRASTARPSPSTTAPTATSMANAASRPPRSWMARSPAPRKAPARFLASVAASTGEVASTAPVAPAPAGAAPHPGTCCRCAHVPDGRSEAGLAAALSVGTHARRRWACVSGPAPAARAPGVRRPAPALRPAMRRWQPARGRVTRDWRSPPR